jgi:hypothetical protein
VRYSIPSNAEGLTRQRDLRGLPRTIHRSFRADKNYCAGARVLRSTLERNLRIFGRGGLLVEICRVLGTGLLGIRE